MRIVDAAGLPVLDGHHCEIVGVGISPSSPYDPSARIEFGEATVYREYGMPVVKTARPSDLRYSGTVERRSRTIADLAVTRGVTFTPGADGERTSFAGTAAALGTVAETIRAVIN